MGSEIYIGRERPTQRLLSFAHYHMATELCFLLRGEAACCIDGEAYAMQVGDLAVINGLSVHYYDLYPNCETLAIVIEKQMLDDFFKQFRSKDGEPCFPIPMQNREANKAILEIALAWERVSKSCNDLQNKGFANLLLGEIVKHYPIHYRQRKAERLSVAALQYIEEHFREEISLQTLAKEFSFSRNTVSRTLHALLGEDLRSYINRLRVKATEQLLREQSDLTVEAAARQCGFQSMNAFYRNWSKYHTGTPKQKEI